MGYLTKTRHLDDAHLRRAVVYGSTMGSFAVERFSIERLLEISTRDIASRLGAFGRLVAFEADLAES
jgi:hypothetical protein